VSGTTQTDAWLGDTRASPSAFVNADDTGNFTPSGPLKWGFPVMSEYYESRLLFAETFGPNQAMGSGGFVDLQIVLTLAGIAVGPFDLTMAFTEPDAGPLTYPM